MDDYKQDPETDFEKLHNAVERLQDAVEMLIAGQTNSAWKAVHQCGRILDSLRTLPKPEGEDK